MARGSIDPQRIFKQIACGNVVDDQGDPDHILYALDALGQVWTFSYEHDEAGAWEPLVKAE